MNKQNKDSSSSSVIRGTTIVSLLTLLSRGLGFVRDLLLARLFGAGLIADAFFVAFRIPNILRSFVAEGALTSAFVPIFSSELEKNHAAAQSALRNVTSFLLSSTILLALAGIIFAPELVALFAPGFSSNPEKAQLCIHLLCIMMPFIICVSLVAMLNGALNAMKIFGAAAFAQVAMNIALIAGALMASFVHDREKALVVAYWVLIGGILQILVQIPAMKRAKLLVAPAFKLFSPLIKQLLKLMFPAILGAAVYQLTMFIGTVLASLLENGSVSWLFYADRLNQLPIGVFTVALASVLLPTLSRAAAKKDEKDFAECLINALRYISFAMIPVSFALFFFAEPLVFIVFERGAFDAYASQKTALALKAAAIGIWGISCHSMIVKAFIARKDTVTPTLVGLLTLLIYVFCALLFMGAPLTGNAGWISAEIIIAVQTFMAKFFWVFDIGHAGLALATSVASTSSFVIVALLISKKLKSIPWSIFFRATVKSLISSSAMYACLYLAHPMFKSTWQYFFWGIPLAIFSFCIFNMIQKSCEFQETFSAFLRVLKRKG